MRESYPGRNRWLIESVTTCPPFITQSTVSSRVMSLVGSPCTAMRSAKSPGSIPPTRSSQPISSAAQDGGGLDGRHRRQAVFDVVGELASGVGVGKDAGVGAEGDLHAGLEALDETSPLGVGGFVVLAEGLRRIAQLRAFLSDPITVVEVGYEPDVVGRHQLDRLVVDEGAVLDRPDSGPDGPLDPFGPVGVCCDVATEQRCLLDRRSDLGLGQLRSPGVVPEVRTAPVAMTLMKSAPRPKICRTVARTSSTPLTTPKRSSLGTAASTSTASPVMSPPPPGQVTKQPAHCIRGPSTHPPSMASRRATSANARNVPISRTVVNPALSVFAGVLDADQCFLGPAASYQRGVAMAGFDLTDQVGVTVDEAGKNGVARQVDDRGIGRHLSLGNERLDAVVDDDDCSIVVVSCRRGSQSLFVRRTRPERGSISRSGSRVDRSKLQPLHSCR